MGVENNECIIATTPNKTAMNKIRAWVATLHKDHQRLFAFIPSLVNEKETMFMGPDGSKKGWKEAEDGNLMRNTVIGFLNTMNYKDGSNPFDWVEVGYGEFGQKVLRGNCRNAYSDRPYEDDANDRQVGGDHYKQFELDPWDAIAIFCPKSLSGVEIYLWGCAFKYLIRLGSKGSPREDIKKAEHYLQKLRETLEKKVTRLPGEKMVEGTSQSLEKPPPTPNPRPSPLTRLNGGYQPRAVQGGPPKPPGED